VIFKCKQAAAERRRATRKEHHKEKEIAKHYRNDNRIKCRQVGERNVSSDEDLSPSPALEQKRAQCRDQLEQHVRVALTFATLGGGGEFAAATRADPS
jgi:hypothetical protein